MRLLSQTGSDPLVRQFYSDDLKLPAIEAPEESRRGQLIEKIYRNEAFLENLKIARGEVDSMRFSSDLSESAYSGVEGFLKATGLYRIDYPKIYTMTMHSGVILEKIRESLDYRKKSKGALYSYMISHTGKRIEYYENLLGGGDQAVFMESPADYLAACGFSEEAHADDPLYLGYGEERLRVDFSLFRMLPVFILLNEETGRAYTLELTDLEQKAAELISSGKSSGSLGFDAEILEITSGGSTETERVVLTIDGSGMTVRR